MRIMLDTNVLISVLLFPGAKKNENIPTEENRTDRYQIGDELDENGYMDRKYVEKKR